MMKEETLNNDKDHWVDGEVIMGRFTKDLTIGDQSFKAIFDTGSERTYITPGVVSKMCTPIEPFDVLLGGKKRTIDKRCIVNAKINGLTFDFSAFPIENLGKIDGDKEVDIIIGATTMEEWNISVDPKKRKINLKGLKKREFMEL